MTQQILVALDHSTFSQTVFNEALKYAHAFQSKLLLLHVLSSGGNATPMMPMVSFPEYYPGVSASTLQLFEQAWEEIEAAGLTRLQQYLEQSEAENIETEIRQVYGAPGPSICKQAKDWGASLILTGRRGHTGLSELLIGSVSNYVLHHAPCSVLVINKLSDQ